LSEQPRSTKSRPYRKAKRAADEMRTRTRIVDAAEALHGTLGPSRTSVSAIAERAAVTRATLYRHFPDAESLFLACSSQWLSRQQLPDPDSWTVHTDPVERLRAGLAEIYRYYRGGEQMIALIHRDADAIPPGVRANGLAAEQRWLNTLLDPFPGRRRKKVQAAVAHAAEFSTWRSLCLTQGLSERSAIELIVGMVTVACGGDQHPT
jgi:AcrR family transcriptional regulator